MAVDASSRHAPDLRLAAALLCVSLIPLAWLAHPALQTQLGVLIAGVIAIGLPHGAADVWLIASSPQLGGVSRWRTAALLIGYLVLAALVWWLWHWLPLPVLIVFFALSALHFGWGDEPGWRSPRWLAAAFARGAMPLLLPCAFQPQPVAAILATLIPQVAETRFAEVLLAARVPILTIMAVFFAGCVWLALASQRGGWSRLLELLVLALVAWTLPPLLGFAVYFCVLHAPRHLAELHRYFGRNGTDRAAVTKQACAITLLTVLLAVSGGFVMRDASMSDLAGSALRLTFFALSALTLPHMLVVAGWQHPGAKSVPSRAVDDRSLLPSR